MTKTDLESYRKLLLTLRARLTGNLSHLAEEALRATGGENSGSLSNTPIHMADLGTDNFEQEFTLSLMQNEEQVLEEIAEALARQELQSLKDELERLEKDLIQAALTDQLPGAEAASPLTDLIVEMGPQGARWPAWLAS